MIFDMEEAGHPDVRIWGHSHARPQGNAQGDGDQDTYDITCTESSGMKWAFTWKDIEEVAAEATNVGNLFPNEAFNESKKVRRFKLIGI